MPPPTRKASRLTSSSSTDDQALVGRIGRAHGLKGAVVVDPLTDRPRERFAPGAGVTLADGTVLTVSRFEATDRSPIITFEQVSDRESAQDLRGQELFIPVDERRPLDDDEFWPDELVGMVVEDTSGESLGHVTEVESGYGQDRIIVETTGGNLVVPFVAELVPEVDRPGRRLVVDLPAGFTY